MHPIARHCVGADGLRVALGKLAGTATPWRDDALVITWDNAFYGTSLMAFALDAEARPIRVEVEGVGAFERAPGKPLAE